MIREGDLIILCRGQEGRDVGPIFPAPIPTISFVRAPGVSAWPGLMRL
jgi:hypothetical protein